MHVLCNRLSVLKARETCQEVGAKVGDSSQCGSLSSHRKGEYLAHNEPRNGPKAHLCIHSTLGYACASEKRLINISAAKSALVMARLQAAQSQPCSVMLALT